MKLQAIFNHFLEAFVSCWFGSEESFLGDGWVGRASELCCCLRALYARNKWRLTTPPHQIKDTYRVSSSLPLTASHEKRRGSEDCLEKTSLCYSTRWRDGKVKKFERGRFWKEADDLDVGCSWYWKDCKSSILDHYGLFTKCGSWVRRVLVL